MGIKKEQKKEKQEHRMNERENKKNIHVVSVTQS